jgi:hypothetical protein
MTQSIPLSDLESSGAAKFETLGDKHVGVITAIDHRQQTDPKDGTPKVFASGDPMMMYVLTIQPENGDAVALWAKGGNYADKIAHGTGDSMLSAIAAAVRAAGATSVEIGAQLAVAFTGESVPTPGLNPAKLFTAQYKAPEAKPQAVAVDDLFSQS